MLILEATNVGPEAQALVAARSQGKVLAVLRNALYLESDAGHVVCVTGATTEDGPLTLRVSDLLSLLDTSRTLLDCPFCVNNSGIKLGNSVRIGLARADVWSPSLPTCIGTRAARMQAAEELTSILMEPNTEPATQTQNLIVS